MSCKPWKDRIIAMLAGQDYSRVEDYVRVRILFSQIRFSPPIPRPSLRPIDADRFRYVSSQCVFDDGDDCIMPDTRDNH